MIVALTPIRDSEVNLLNEYNLVKYLCSDIFIR